MIQINKGIEPLEWTEKKNTPGFTAYEPINELRDALLIEQGYICAYCMQRIPVKDVNVETTSKIEHIQSREARPDLQLSYANMAICCPGNLNDEAHCDKLKGRRSVTFDLQTQDLQQSLKYSSKDGSIASGNVQWNKEITELLNLNHSFLKANRRETLAGVIDAIASKGWSEATIRRKYREWSQKDSSGKYLEFCGIVIWYLAKKLKQSSN
jgi:uncharacterized protein (TIGR02646 family)